ncbi:MAG: aminotransferase class I/II-fold pyridoxal phosphate-dependent enzyme, partial [Rudaea sp.]
LARPYVYTTAAPPILAAALLASLRIIRDDASRRAHLAQLIFALRAGLRDLPWKLVPSMTPIQPLMVGEVGDAVRIGDALAARGILVPAIRPPTVPAGTARLRISLSAAHTQADVAALAAALREVAAETA